MQYQRIGGKTKVDINNVDFSQCETMLNMFGGCSILTLDCSGWDITNCENISGFNTDAPGVIPPVLK